MIALIVMFAIYSILSQADYNKGKGSGSTGRNTLIARIVLSPLFIWLVWLDIGNWWIASGFIAVAQWWIWDTFTGMLFYRKFFKTGETKTIDNFFKFIPDLVLWGIRAFIVILILSVYYNYYGRY